MGLASLGQSCNRRGDRVAELPRCTRGRANPRSPASADVWSGPHAIIVATSRAGRARAALSRPAARPARSIAATSAAASTRSSSAGISSPRASSATTRASASRYRVDRATSYCELDSLFRGAVDIALIRWGQHHEFCTSGSVGPGLTWLPDRAAAAPRPRRGRRPRVAATCQPESWHQPAGPAFRIRTAQKATIEAMARRSRCAFSPKPSRGRPARAIATGDAMIDVRPLRVVDVGGYLRHLKLPHFAAFHWICGSRWRPLGLVACIKVRLIKPLFGTWRLQTSVPQTRGPHGRAV